MSRTTIKEQSDEMWDSVFWNEDNYRPDRTTRVLNEIVKKLGTETRKKLADMFPVRPETCPPIKPDYRQIDFSQ
jgi:hypothetical protein